MKKRKVAKQVLKYYLIAAGAFAVLCGIAVFVTSWRTDPEPEPENFILAA